MAKEDYGEDRSGGFGRIPSKRHEDNEQSHCTTNHKSGSKLLHPKKE
jgi:hypothetical protein